MRKKPLPRLMRILSTILVFALLFTSSVTPIFAAELISAGERASIAGIAATPTPLDTDELPHADVLALLVRLDDYDSFTEAERAVLYTYVGIGYDETRAAADEARVQAALYAELERLPQSLRTELRVLSYEEAGRSFADLTPLEKQELYDYLQIADEQYAAADALFAELAQTEEGLFAQMLLVETVSDGYFTLDEARALTARYPNRAERDAEIGAFRAFAASLAMPSSVTAARLRAAAMPAAASALRTEKAAYLSASAFLRAKEMLLAGSRAEEIRAAYAVAATLSLDPDDLLIAHSLTATDTVTPIGGMGTSLETSLSAEETALLALYPVKLSPVREKLSTTASRNTAELTAAVVAMDNALYSAASAGNSQTGDDSNVVNPPFLADLAGETGVSLNTGAAYHAVDLVNLPGVNGYDLNLGITYSSADAHTVRKADGSALGARLFAFADVSEYLIYGSVMIRCNYTTYMQEVASVADASPILNSYAAMHGTISYTGFVASDTKTITQTQTSNTVITGTYTPYEITGVTNSNSIPSTIPYSDSDGYTGTLTPYRSEQYNTGIIATGANTWQQIIYTTTYFAGTVTATSNVRYTSVERSGVLQLAMHSSLPSEQTYGELRANIGAGWMWNIPSIELDADDSMYAYLHLPSMGTLKFSEVNVGGRYGFYNHSASDVELYAATNFTSPQGITSAYRARLTGGYNYYFSADGRLLMHCDRYGNMITYGYTSTTAGGLLSSITDTAGRVVTITYAQTANGMTVTVTAPDNTASVLTLTTLPWMTAGNYALTAVTHPDNTQTLFSYTAGTGYYHNTSKTPTAGSAIPYALLTGITSPTGAVLAYSYAPVTVNRNFIGAESVFRVTERKWLAGTTEYKKQTFTYTGEYTNYPNIGTYLPMTYAYAVQVTENNGTYRQYSFGSSQQLTMTTLFGSDGLPVESTNYTYNDNGYPTSAAHTYYHGTNSITSLERFTYDARGNVLTHLSPKANGNAALMQYQTTNPDANDTNAFRYAGQYFDAETGTYYLRARYYSLGIGRFTQQDGWGYSNIGDPLRLNLYTYCGGNPIKYIDPSGHYYIAIGGT